MRRWFVVLGLLAGCQKIFGLDHVGELDAGVDGKIYLDAPPPGTVCAGVAGAPLHICAQQAALQALTYSSNITINTDDDATCTHVESAMTRQHALCEVIATDLTIESSATLRAYGSRPLVVVAMSTMTIAGTIDVSSHTGNSQLGAAADDVACIAVNGAVQGTGASSSQGGAGGSFGSRGGAGGGIANGTALMASPPIDPTTLALVRGGCPGGAGGTDHSMHTAAGGHSGGAVYLMAGTQLTISGAVLANGTGGQGGASSIATDFAGGAGGGTGGLIMVDTPSLTLDGVLMASGGGGGAGTSDTGAGGNRGADPTPSAPTTAAPGGSTTGDKAGGTGGDGSTTSAPQQGGFGGALGTSTGAGGGGGGGKGVIRGFGSAVVGGTVVPGAT